MRTLTLIPEHGCYDVLVLNVVDADTVDVALLVPLRVRLHGVQAAERGTEKGRRATAALTERLAGKTVGCEFRGREKYGRTLARLTLAGTGDVADWLVAEGLAVPWDGKGPRPVGMAGPPPADGGELEPFPLPPESHPGWDG